MRRKCKLGYEKIQLRLKVGKNEMTFRTPQYLNRLKMSLRREDCIDRHALLIDIINNVLHKSKQTEYMLTRNSVEYKIK